MLFRMQRFADFNLICQTLTPGSEFYVLASLGWRLNYSGVATSSLQRNIWSLHQFSWIPALAQGWFQSIQLFCNKQWFGFLVIWEILCIMRMLDAYSGLQPKYLWFHCFLDLMWNYSPLQALYIFVIQNNMMQIFFVHSTQFKDKLEVGVNHSYSWGWGWNGNKCDVITKCVG